MEHSELNEPVEGLPTDTNPRQQPTFRELVELNAGVVLEPLASKSPAQELDPTVISGISELPSAIVKGIVNDHTEMPETGILLGRFKEIRRLHEINKAGVATAPVETTPKPKRARKPETPQKTLAETLQERVFEDPENPSPERLPLIVAKSASDPATLHTIEEAFVRNGHDLNDPAKAEMAESVKTFIQKGYKRYLFKFVPTMSLAQVQKLTSSWIGQLDRPEDGIWLDLHQAVIRTVIIDSSAEAGTLGKLIDGVLEGSRELTPKVDSNRFQELVKPAMRTIKDKARTFPSDQRQVVFNKTDEELQQQGVNRSVLISDPVTAQIIDASDAAGISISREIDDQIR